MIKIELKTLAGAIAFTWESEKNTVKETVEEFLKTKKGQWIMDMNMSGLNLSGIDFSNSEFDNSEFDNSKFYNSEFYNSKFYNSKFDNSKFYNSKFDNSKFYNSKFYNSEFDNSKFYNSKFDNSEFDKNSIINLELSGALEPIRFDFFGRMLVLKNEVPFLRKALLEGRIDGTSYTAECGCFMGTVAKAKGCNYMELPGIKPDSASDTEKWFLSIRKGDTPEKSEVAKLTLKWIDDFLILIGNPTQ